MIHAGTHGIVTARGGAILLSGISGPGPVITESGESRDRMNDPHDALHWSPPSGGPDDRFRGETVFRGRRVMGGMHGTGRFSLMPFFVSANVMINVFDVKKDVKPPVFA